MKRPTDPRLRALVGKRFAGSYSWCDCGGIKARRVRRCQACREDGVGGPYLVFKGRRKSA